MRTAIRPTKSRSTPFDAEIGERIRAQRLSRGLSQEELAGRLGITFQQLQKYEKGANRLSAGRLRDIAGALRIPMVSLYGPDSFVIGRAGDAQGVQQFITSSRAIKLLKQFSKLNASDQNLIVDLCERLANR
ncbi:helix-turn-helix transcriptional regulator [Bradyrhizobium sp. 21]|uniref:helix-turn-helix domain-containing protein n=1 Tax=Bradyrhizobium sp. 21 TaxID=2782666 RepID=UPI001FF78CA3|nr:helix-turn-helix transcriptional regulator [Bradyrhizobium sp. 21]MCK1387644.1 helix-turn-helix transcriptional regulator [Bradyrhizobium sp. 21]